MNRVRLGTHTEFKRICAELNQGTPTNLSPLTIGFLQSTGFNWRKLLESKRKWFACRVCHQIFSVYPAEIRKKPETAGMYCSVSCRQKVNVQKAIRYNREHGTGGQHWTEERKQAARKAMLGEKNWAWKGGVTYFRKHGNYQPIKYVRCPQAFLQMARKDGYVMEHRLLVAMAIGRPLLGAEVVHHLDHDPRNNAIENLALYASNQAHKLREGGNHIKPLWQGSPESRIADSSIVPLFPLAAL